MTTTHSPADHGATLLDRIRDLELSGAEQQTITTWFAGRDPVGMAAILDALEHDRPPLVDRDDNEYLEQLRD
ncbi:MAG: hypothetical protein ACRDWT_05010, partial [Jatrophihabitantaceae bacterium]